MKTKYKYQMEMFEWNNNLADPGDPIDETTDDDGMTTVFFSRYGTVLAANIAPLNNIIPYRYRKRKKTTKPATI